MTLTDITGFIGVTILLIAYLLNLIGKLENNSFRYLALNFFGAGIACLASFMMHYVPFIILEGTWTAVSLIGIIKRFTKK